MTELTKDFTVWMREGFCGQYIKSAPELSSQMTKRLELADGTTLSVQAGATHYCEPRENAVTGDYDFYDSFEIGYPSVEIPEIMQYAEEPDHPTDTVYGRVPKQVIRDLIAARGGVAGFDDK